MRLEREPGRVTQEPGPFGLGVGLVVGLLAGSGFTMSLSSRGCHSRLSFTVKPGSV